MSRPEATPPSTIREQQWEDRPPGFWPCSSRACLEDLCRTTRATGPPGGGAAGASTRDSKDNKDNKDKAQNGPKPEDRERWKWWLYDRVELGINDQQSAAINQIFESTIPKLRETRQELDKAEELSMRSRSTRRISRLSAGSWIGWRARVLNTTRCGS